MYSGPISSKEPLDDRRADATTSIIGKYFQQWDVGGQHAVVESIGEADDLSFV